MNQVAFDQLNYNLPVLSDHPSYIEGCLELTVSKFRGYDRIPDLEKDLFNVNAYEHLNILEEPEMNDKTLNKSDYIKAWKCILDGKLFTEHFAAGEATCFKLGTKFLINIQKGFKDYAQLFFGLT